LRSPNFNPTFPTTIIIVETQVDDDVSNSANAKYSYGRNEVRQFFDQASGTPGDRSAIVLALQYMTGDSGAFDSFRRIEQ